MLNIKRERARVSVETVTERSDLIVAKHRIASRSAYSSVGRNCLHCKKWDCITSRAFKDILEIVQSSPHFSHPSYPNSKREGGHSHNQPFQSSGSISSRSRDRERRGVNAIRTCSLSRNSASECDRRPAAEAEVPEVGWPQH